MRSSRKRPEPEPAAARLRPSTESGWKDKGHALTQLVPGLRLAYVFGSVARSSAGPLSDLDVALQLPAEHMARTNLLARGRLQIELERLFGVPELDLVLLDEAPLSLQYSVARDGILLYAADAIEEQRWRLLTMRMYFDLEPFLRLHRDRLRDQLSRGTSGG